MTDFLTDLRRAGRILRRSPWYALTAIGVLGIGIALTTVAFAVVDGVLFKPLPFPRVHELHLIRADVSTRPHVHPPPVSSRDVRAWREASPDLHVTVIGHDPRSSEASVDDRFFEVTGVRPHLGGFSPADFDWLRDSERVAQRVRPVLLAHDRWLKEFGGDPTVIGRTIILTRRPGFVSGIRIAGVLAPGFVFPLDAGAAPPDSLGPIPREFRASERREFHAIARIASTEVVAVSERLTAASRRLPEAVPPHNQPPAQRMLWMPFDEVRLIPLTEHLARHERPAFALVFAGAGILLLLASVNVAGLVAARNVERRRDLAIRRALGADGWVLTRGLLAEVALLAVAATAVALLLARPMLVWTVDLLPATVTVLKAPVLDIRVLAAAAALAVATALVVAVWPAHAATRFSLGMGFDGLDATTTRATRRSMRPVVATQVALGFVLLTAGGLTVTSLATAWRNDTGFHRDRMILLELFVNSSSSQRETLEKLETLPDLLRAVAGVQQVATSTINPIFKRSGTLWTSVIPEGWMGAIEGVVSRQVSPAFFEVMGLRLVDGRWPASGEWNGSRLAIVSETAARMLWPDGPAVGRVLISRSARSKETPRTVIAVVADARYVALDQEPIGDIYLPDPMEDGRYGLFFHIRTSGPAHATLPTVLAALSGRGFRIEQAATHESALFASVKHRALPAWLFGSLGLAALVVLGAGILGLLAMSTAQRTREIGIRIALGATTGRVAGMLAAEQLSAVALGIIGGALASLWMVRLLQAQLYGVRPHDPGVWAAVSLVILGIATLGTLVPSLRASRVDPVHALRHDPS